MAPTERSPTTSGVPPVAATAALTAVLAVVLGACLVGSTGLVLARTGDPSSRRLVELVSLTPLGLPLAAAAACLACVLAVRARRRLASGSALVLALALLAVHASWLAPLYVAGPADSVAGGSVVVMTLNVEVADAGDLAAAVRDRDVDVLVLLEVGEEWLDELRGTGITSELPHVAGVEDGDGVGTVVLSRFAVTGDAALYPGAESRVVRLDTRVLGPVDVVAIHTRPPYLPDGWRADHDRVAEALVRLGTDVPVLLAGDFNATPAHVPMRRITGLGFTDAADQVGAGWSPSWPAGGHLRRLGVAVPSFAAIDHVLTGPGLAVARSATLDVADADHRAVVATITRAAR